MPCLTHRKHLAVVPHLERLRAGSWPSLSFQPQVTGSKDRLLWTIQSTGGPLLAHTAALCSWTYPHMTWPAKQVLWCLDSSRPFQPLAGGRGPCCFSSSLWLAILLISFSSAPRNGKVQCAFSWEPALSCKHNLLPREKTSRKWPVPNTLR